MVRNLMKIIKKWLDYLIELLDTANPPYGWPIVKKARPSLPKSWQTVV